MAVCWQDALPGSVNYQKGCVCVKRGEPLKEQGSGQQWAKVNEDDTTVLPGPGQKSQAGGEQLLTYCPLGELFWVTRQN